MLTLLRVKNLALVEEATVAFEPGLNIITGETGAGKSILIGALYLLLGERADTSAIRAGETQCVVEATFQLAEPQVVNDILTDTGLEPCDHGLLILRRTVKAAGGGQAFVNDAPVTLPLLKRLGAHLVDLHGPHDHQSLFQPASQLDILDSFARADAERAAYAAAGHPGKGHISLMLHTFVGDDIDDVRDTVREPFLEYLRTSTDLINQVRWEQTSFAKPTAQRTQPGEAQDLSELSAEEMAVIMDHAFDRYFRTAGLFGTPESCRETVQRLADLGVDELACLIDFGVDEQRVLDGLRQLDALRRLTNPEPGASAVVDPAGDDSLSAGDDWGLIAQFERHEVTHFQCTPSHAAVIAATPEGMTALARLRKLLLGGEALPAALADRIRPQIRGDLLNMYGPTETTIWSTVSPILAAGRPITIGRPIANTEIHIVDRHLQPNPIGVAGELLIGGAGGVRGYLDRPELTDERFVALPAAGGDRVYRTGDLARMRADGEIEFSGRLDHQEVIIMGEVPFTEKGGDQPWDQCDHCQCRQWLQGAPSMEGPQHWREANVTTPRRGPNTNIAEWPWNEKQER